MVVVVEVIDALVLLSLFLWNSYAYAYDEVNESGA